MRASDRASRPEAVRACGEQRQADQRIRKQPARHANAREHRLRHQPRDRLGDGVDGNQRDRDAEIVDWRQALPAIHSSVRARFELIVAEQPAVVRGVVVGEIDVVVGPETYGSPSGNVVRRRPRSSFPCVVNVQTTTNMVRPATSAGRRAMREVIEERRTDCNAKRTSEVRLLA